MAKRLEAFFPVLYRGNAGLVAHEGIVDAMGHVSARHPDNPKQYLLARARSPEVVEAGDIMAFHLDGTPVEDRGQPMYIERHIHGAIFEARPEVMAVVHNHCPEVLPFAITRTPMRPAVHFARRLGPSVPVWDIQDHFGDTDLLVTTMEQGRDLASVLRANKAALMRGHGNTVVGGSVREAVFRAVFTELAARLASQAVMLAGAGGKVTYLTPGEAKLAMEANVAAIGRPWEHWKREVL